MLIWVSDTSLGEIISLLQETELATHIKIVNYLDSTLGRRFLIDLNKGQVKKLDKSIEVKSIKDRFGGLG